MQRRTVLAGIAGGVSIGGVAAYTTGVFDDPPFTLSVYNADGDETDVSCGLPDGFLDDHPVVADLVAAVGENPPTEPEQRGISRDRASSLLSDLESHCETTGGLYDIQGEWYFISISGEAHSHSGDTGDDHSH